MFFISNLSLIIIHIIQTVLMAEAAKKTGGANPPRYNPVQTMMIFEEKVHKEQNFQRGYQKREYTINPFTMAVIADKPNYVTPKEPFMTKPAGAN
jgi:hypothetical protein